MQLSMRLAYFVVAFGKPFVSVVVGNNACCVLLLAGQLLRGLAKPVFYSGKFVVN